jgi:glycerol-3-phosphate dehydrogenase subunit C
MWVLVPDAQPKRVRVAKQLTNLRPVALPFDEEVLRYRLRAIRDDTVEHLDDLLGQLTSTLRQQYGLTVLEKTTAQEAADDIARLAGPSRRVLVNRSATVAEMLPFLKAHGLEIVETYDGQFSHPDQGVERYWQLAPPPAEAAWRAFHPQRIKPSSPQSPDIAVLGVNAIAADDGTVFFVQHLFNISEMLEQASQVVLVIGVERVVRDRDAAEFVVRAQARYGLLSIALGVPRRGDDTDGTVPGEQSSDSSPPALDAQGAPMHVVLLDNGRRAWLSDPRYRDLFLCIGCRSCLLECPTQPFFGRETGWTPRDYLTAFLRGDNGSLRACITCGRCLARCPLDIDLPAMISEAEAEAGATRWQDQFYCNIGLLFRASSLAAPLSNRMFSWPLTRLPMEWVTGMDREHKLPRFTRDTFQHQYQRRSPSPALGRMVVYYPGCYVNFTDPELGWATVGILERNGFQVLVPKHLCCGVASFPYGAKELARRYARQALKVFGPLAREGHTILVSCPSCGMALGHEYAYLFPESDDARLVAEQTRDVSDFLWDLFQQGELDPDFGPLELRVGYHTPCHLRVRDLGPENLSLLDLIPGIEAVDIDRGCCGLAGSFGMRRAHREESHEIGRYLFRALQSPDFDLGITNCAGCEMQIRAGSSRDVVHPLKLLWRAYCPIP